MLINDLLKLLIYQMTVLYGFMVLFFFNLDSRTLT